LFNSLFNFTKPGRFLESWRSSKLAPGSHVVETALGQQLKKKRVYRNSFIFFFNMGLRIFSSSLLNQRPLNQMGDCLKEGGVITALLKKGSLAAISGGSYAVLFKKKCFFVLLPSGISKKVSLHLRALLGRGLFKTSGSLKSSKFFFKSSRLSVRGCAKNAVDHKNGGSGRGGIRRSSSP
jgi:hypothetical protein